MAEQASSASVTSRPCAYISINTGGTSLVNTTPSVLLDATSIPPAHGGVARFIGGVLTGLAENGVSIDVVAKRADLPWLASIAPGHRYRVAPPAVDSRLLRFVWEQLGLPRLARKLGCTVIHSPHYTFPLVTKARSVVTVHDATFFSSPEAHSALKGRFFRSWIRLARARADQLVAVSAATASEITRFAGTPHSPIAVAHLGVDTAVFQPPTDDDVAVLRTHLGLSPHQRWIAFLGTMEPRKNIPALLAAHARLRAADSSTPVLVLSGARGWDVTANAELDAIAAAPRSERSVIEAGYLPLGLLKGFLGGADLVVYPSLGEGFGLPVLEAMSCGTAVLTTNRLSIPEVGGEAVAYTEPDTDSIAVALGALLRDGPRRQELALAGLSRSQLFTWSECAARYSAAYEPNEGS
jgi:glycosyltransferase involved in cell wall biosynthesis